MTTTYTLSFYTKEKTPVLVRRPWWNLFGMDRIEMQDQLVRKVLSDIPGRLYADLQSLHNVSLWELLSKSFGIVYNVQLEANGPTYEYIPGEMSKVKFWPRCGSDAELSIITSWNLLADEKPADGQMVKFTTIAERYSSPIREGIYTSAGAWAISGLVASHDGIFKTTDGEVWSVPPQWTWWIASEGAG